MTLLSAFLQRIVQGPIDGLHAIDEVSVLMFTLEFIGCTQAFVGEDIALQFGPDRERGWVHRGKVNASSISASTAVSIASSSAIEEYPLSTSQPRNRG